MIKIFCDICEKDITNYRGTKIEGKNERLTVSILTAIDNVWNGGHACVDCIKKACKNIEVELKHEQKI